MTLMHPENDKKNVLTTLGNEYTRVGGVYVTDQVPTHIMVGYVNSTNPTTNKSVNYFSL
jgi:hypothetical protein